MYLAGAVRHFVLNQLISRDCYLLSLPGLLEDIGTIHTRDVIA